MRVLTLFARHGAERYPGAPDAIRALFAHQLPEVDHDLLVIDNALDDALDSKPDGLVVGDNASWEFSGWDRAIAILGDRFDGYDLIHFATSAFNELYTGYLRRVDFAALAAIAGKRRVLGHLDFGDRPVLIEGQLSQAWLRSAFFFLPPREVRLLGTMTSRSPEVAVDYFSGDWTAPFRDDAPISLTGQKTITRWLTGDGGDQGTAWHSRFVLEQGSLGLFEAKARAILNERLLSQRLSANGCDLVDITWLASQLAQGEMSGTVPAWRMQIAERDENAVALSVLLDRSLP